MGVIFMATSPLAIEAYEIDFLVEQAHQLQDESKYPEALALWDEVIRLEPDNLEHQLCYARVQAWNRCWCESECRVQSLLAKNPRYCCAWVLLGQLYFWQERPFEASVAFHRALEIDPCSVEALEALGRVYLAQCAFHKAYCILSRALMIAPSDCLWKLWLASKEFVAPSVELSLKYANSKEKSSIYNVYTTQGQFFEDRVKFFIPLSDASRLSLQPFMQQQQEQNLVLGGNNFNTTVIGLETVLENQWSDGYRMRSYLRVKQSQQGRGFTYFDFLSSTRFEPGVLFVKEWTTASLFLAAYNDSIIIKDFSNYTSEMMGQWHASGAIQKEVCEEAWWLGSSFEWVWINDSLDNHKYEWIGFTRVGVPWCTKWFDVTGQYRQAGYLYPSPNYYSFKWQSEWQMVARIYHEFKDNIYTEASYMRGWQLSRQLYDPGMQIALTDPELNRQYLNRNRLRLQCYGWYNHCIRLEGGLEYYWDSSDYRAVIAQLALRYQF